MMRTAEYNSTPRVVRVERGEKVGQLRTRTVDLARATVRRNGSTQKAEEGQRQEGFSESGLALKWSGSGRKLIDRHESGASSILGD